MRLEADQWAMNIAVKMGHYHMDKAANCQDAAGGFVSGSRLYGVGCDGCGEGDRSEVGAVMLSEFALSEIARLNQSPISYNFNEICSILFNSLTRFIYLQIHMSCQSSNPHDIAQYVKNHWLATMIGFIYDTVAQNGIIFYCGDGVYTLDDTLHVIDQNNTPVYLAYHCLQNPETCGVGPEMMPGGFNIIPIESGVSKFMIASDGFIQHNKLKIEQNGLPDNLHGQQWDKKGQFGLKKWLNSRWDKGYLFDDCFVITAERISCKP
ncbi:MAG: protein phosphatase 2C domain-containing protein [Bacteroidales bacterium]|jgi:hypothetical protein